MNILLSAYECSPYRGSEAICGWKMAYHLSKNNHNIYLLTRKRNLEDINKYIKLNKINNIVVFPIEVPNPLMFLYNKTNAFYICYQLWQIQAYQIAKKLNASIKFDIIHHLTLGDFRTIGYLWKLKAPFIFGPIGGAQVTPNSLKKYTKGHFLEEKIREIVNYIFSRNWQYIKGINKAEAILFCNEETEKYLLPLISNRNKCYLLTENGIEIPSKFNAINGKKESGYIQILWAGRFLYRKGIKLLFDALKYIDDSILYKLVLVGDGPDLENIQRLCIKSKLEQQVVFKGAVEYSCMKDIYYKSDIFVFPSLRETTGTVLFEAMSYKLPIITLNQNGGKLLINDSCGIRINVQQENVAKAFGEAITFLAQNKIIREKMGEEGFKKICSEYSWENKTKTILQIYKDILEKVRK